MFVNLDMYGHTIGVTYRGGDKYKTRCGALVTIATYVLIIINTLSLLVAFNDGSNQEELVQSTKFDRSLADAVDLVEQDLEILIVMTTQIDPSFAEIVGTQISGYEEDDGEFLDIGECSEKALESAEEFWLPKIGEDWLLLKPFAQCVRDSSLILQGDSST